MNGVGQARAEKYGDLQWSIVSQTDRDEAYRVRQAGTQALLKGESDVMITLVREPIEKYHRTTGQVALEEIADHERSLPDAYFDEENMMVKPAFYEYGLPLLEEPLPEYAKI